MRVVDQTLAGHSAGDSLGQRFAECRARAGISRADASKAIGISAAQLGRIERGGGVHGQ